MIVSYVYSKALAMKSFVIGACLTMLPFIGLAQLGPVGENPFSVNILPPSPQAAALAKYADIPVSLYSGTPNISIPLYELRERKLTLPINLSYHASGNKVETVAPHTGLGWTVSAEGVVTRSVRGWPDEHTRGFLDQARQHQISDFAPGYRDSQLQYEWFDAMADGCKDVEPDLFYVNVAGYSFKFMFNWAGQPVIASDQKFKVEPIGLNPGANDFIDGWTITAPDGTIFVFNVIERVNVASPSDHTLGCNLALDDSDIPQSWYLSEMRTPDQQTWIRFEYTNYTQTNESWSTETKMHNQALAPTHVSRERLETSIYGKHLSKITTSSGQTVIDFLPGAQRTDVDGSESTLGQVIVKNINGKAVKHWTFEYDYSSRKLMLKKLTELAGTASQPPFEFLYTGGLLPSLTSTAKDHWGFYNSNNFETLIPATTVPRISGPAVVLSGAIRDPDPSRVLIGMLREIHYPTGGKDVLVFEPHDYSFEQNRELIQEISIPRSHSGGVPDWDTPSGEVDEERSVFTITSPTDINWHAWFSYGAIFGGGTAAEVSFAIIRNSDNTNMIHLAPGGAGMEDENGEVIPEEIEERGVLRLQPGTYTFIVRGKMGNNTIGRNFVTASIGWNEGTGQITTLIKQGGGVRIAKITRSFGNGNPDKITRYTYRIQEDREKSSGSLLESGYRYEQWILYRVSAGGNTGTDEQRFLRFSQNRSALGTTQGSHVGYSHVTVLQGENGENGKTVYRYNSPRQIGDYASWELPYPPAQSHDYRRGLLLEQTDYAGDGEIVRKITNDYKYHNEEVLAIKVGWAIPGDGPFGPGHLNRYALGNYANIMGYTRLIETKDASYPSRIGFVHQAGVAYKYNESSHKQLVRMAQKTSEPDSVITQYTYPHDFGANTVFDLMKERHMVNHVIETVTSRKGFNTQLSLVGAGQKQFNNMGGVIVPITERSARITTPILTTNPITTARPLFEDRLEYNRYDSYGNLLEHCLKYGVNTAYQWGHNATVPVAKADHAGSRQIFFTSFEEDSQASSAHSRTGKKSKALNGTYTVPATPTVAGTYVLSYWVKEGTEPWAYREKSFSNYQPGSIMATNAVNGYLDEVRVYPKGAVMTTYTYEPLVGVTSVTDTNNVTAYYSYDAFGRLLCIRDQDQNIIECNDYQYQQEVPYVVGNE